MEAGVLMTGVIWAKYGLWAKKALTLDQNIEAGQWIVFATWPDDLKRTLFSSLR
jgi:hypothetical protein